MSRITPDFAYTIHSCTDEIRGILKNVMTDDELEEVENRLEEMDDTMSLENTNMTFFKRDIEENIIGKTPLGAKNKVVERKERLDEILEQIEARHE